MVLTKKRYTVDLVNAVTGNKLYHEEYSDTLDHGTAEMEKRIRNGLYGTFRIISSDRNTRYSEFKDIEHQVKRK